MVAPTDTGRACRNDGCSRLAEPGDVYCGECGLERSLFRRDARLRSSGDRGDSGDVTDRGSVAAAIALAVARWGRLDILVNNAGLGGPTPLEDPDDARWDAIIATNLTAVFRVVREASPFLPPGGRVINMSSVLGR